MKFASLTKAALSAALFSRSAFGTELEGRRGNLRKLQGPTSCDGNAVVLELKTDTLPKETSWRVEKDGMEIVSGSGYSSRLERIEEDMCLPNGDYTFTINDVGGDGICCNNGSGFYALKLGATVLAFGRSFASSETTDFTVGGAVGETGRIGLTHVENTISFRNSYVNPVVVAFMNTRNGADSTDVRVYDVTANSFKIFLDEAPGNDGPHVEEEVSYIVMEEGSHTIDGGLTVQAGRHTTTSVRRATQNFVGDEITLDAEFTGTPAVLATLNTYNNGEFMTTLVTDVFDHNFELSQEALETGSTATEEMIGWMAFSTGSGVNLISGYAPADRLKDGVGQNGITIDLTPAGFSALPDLVVGVYGEHGKDGSYARGAGVFSATTQAVFAEEDMTQDTERQHNSEPFAWVGFAHDSDLFSVSATSYEASACKVAEDECADSSECCSGECLGDGNCM